MFALDRTPAQVQSFRQIVLFGRNTATYKIALARALILLAWQGQTRVSHDDLADLYLDLYVERLDHQLPQLRTVTTESAIERIVTSLGNGTISRDQATRQTAREGFRYVLDAFHTVYSGPADDQFFVRTEAGITLTDACHAVANAKDVQHLAEEINSRWDLLEAEFDRVRYGGELVNDTASLGLQRATGTRLVTPLWSVLHGYQDGRCFHCDEVLGHAPLAIIHWLPRTHPAHDEPWNLVLVHATCMPDDAIVPPLATLARLAERNERLIASHDPLRPYLARQQGATRTLRENHLRRSYDAARERQPRQW